MSVKGVPSPASPPPADKLRFLDTLPKHPNITIGEYTYGNGKFLPAVRWMNGNATDPKLTIGKYCSFANDVIIIMGGNHRSDWITTYPFRGPAMAKQTPVTKGDVTIGNDVWIASEAMILSGVTIGDGAIIGARAVVSRDVPPYTVAAGNPAKIVRKRFSDEVIAKLLELRWWDWEQPKIEKYLDILCSGDVHRLGECV